MQGKGSSLAGGCSITPGAACRVTSVSANAQRGCKPNAGLLLRLGLRLPIQGDFRETPFTRDLPALPPGDKNVAAPGYPIPAFLLSRFFLDFWPPC
jgi:hypothetical protein